MGPFVANIASSGIYDALRSLLSRHPDETVIELHEHRADGSYSTAVIQTNDPEVLRVALERLPGSGDDKVKLFDADAGRWSPLPPADNANGRESS